MTIAAEQFHEMHERGGWPTHADCPVCYQTHYRAATLADLREMEVRLTMTINDGLDGVRDALTADETAQAAADARVTELLQELADAAKNPTPADPGAVDDLVKRIQALTARDTADSTAGQTPPSGSEASA